MKRIDVMKRIFQSGVAAIALTALGAPAHAADLGGSIKDGYAQPPVYAAPAMVGGSSCYFRSSIGYSWSRDPQVQWTGTTFDNIEFGNSFVGEGAIGCGSAGDRGLRGELSLAARGAKKFKADIKDSIIGVVPADPITGDPAIPSPMVADPAHTSVKTYTAMVNAYYDLGNHGGFVPYVGAGVGLAYNKMNNVYFTNSPFNNEIIGANQLSLAWAVMAGVEYKFSQRASLDIGYRYIDTGSVHSDHGDSGNNWNPRFKLDDLAAHELMVGVRYKFCGPTC
jgi:opacity protein-like surface antigen